MNDAPSYQLINDTMKTSHEALTKARGIGCAPQDSGLFNMLEALVAQERATFMLLLRWHQQAQDDLRIVRDVARRVAE